MDARLADEFPASPGGASRGGTSGLGVGIWSWRPADGSLVWSDGVQALLQLPPDHSASWECWLKQVHPDDQDMVRRTLLPPACDREHTQTLDYRLIRSDGSMIHIEDRRHMNVDGICQGVFIDVTKTATSGRDSLRAGSCAQRVMEAAGIGVFFRDFQNGQDYWNEALYTIFGLTGSTSPPACDQLPPGLHPEDADRVTRHIDACRTSGRTLNLEYRIVTPAGEQRWVRERGSYLKAADGQLLNYYGALQDVTDEKLRTAELEESRHLLNLALESNAMGVWEYNKTTGRRIWSDQFCRIMGYVPGDVTPGLEAWLAILHPDDRDWAVELWEADSQSDVHAFTYRIITAGKVRWIRDSWKDFTGDDGSRIRLGVTADITDWKEREHRYAITDRWLALAVAGGRIGLWSHDGPARAYHWNDYMFTLLGYRQGEIEPTKEAWYDRVHPDDTERVRAAIEEKRADDREYVVEYRVLLPGNVERWLEERGSAKESDSSVYHGVLFDITDKKAFQHQLETSRQRLQLALDTGKMGFWTGHEEKEEWDERTYRILGYEPFSVPASSETFMRIVHPEDRQDALAFEDRSRRSGDFVIQEYRIVKPDGAVRWVESRRWHTAGEQPDRYGVVVDITDRKAREEFHIRSQRLEAAGQLLHGLAHDFNNFLAVISATLEPIGEMAHDPETARRLLVARQAAMAGALFSRRLINVSKHRDWRPQRLSIGKHVSRLASIMRPLMSSSIMLSMQYPDDLWPIYVDPLECDSAIINLLINARDAISAAGSITITVTNQHVKSEAAKAPGGAGEYVVLTVRDTGKGMDDSTIERATEPFFTTKPEGAGTGLGLSSVEVFTAAAGGYLKIESEPGAGTSVSLHLPRACEAADTAAKPFNNALRGDGELVLVVDDEASVREITMQRLEALGYAVEEAPDAISAVGALQSTDAFALVLSDVNMPGPMNGLGLRDRLAVEMPHIPVVLITAHEEMTGGAGQMQILSKFCSQTTLAQALAAALASRGQRKLAQEGTQETGAART